jgi:AcrR family transcriptional regulator
MGRSAAFDRNQFIRTAVHLIAKDGPGSLGVQSLAHAMGAPTGSFYHRYPSRAEMLGDVWMTVVEDFQEGFLEGLKRDEVLEAARTAALHTVAWVQKNPEMARVLLFSRRRDFERDSWSSGLKARERKAKRMLETGLAHFARRVFGPSASAESVFRLRFAVIDAPGAAVRPYLESREEIPAFVSSVIVNTCNTTLRRR